MDALYDINRKQYKTVCVELAFVKVTFDRMVIILIFKECMIKGRNSH